MNEPCHASEERYIALPVIKSKVVKLLKWISRQQRRRRGQPMATTSCQYKENYNNLILYIYLKGNKIPINFSTKM